MRHTTRSRFDRRMTPRVCMANRAGAAVAGLSEDVAGGPHLEIVLAAIPSTKSGRAWRITA